MDLKLTNSTNFSLKNFLSSTNAKVYVLFMIFLPLINFAQSELPRHYVSYNLDIKPDTHYSKSSSQTITETISQEGATWLRLFFKDVNLGKHSTLTITSALDGHTQTLNASTIRNWNNSTAYFNGDKVIVKLYKAPNDKSIEVNIKEIGVGELEVVSKTQCGSTDDRVDANDAAIGRIVPIGCTGWIIANGRLVTAGHCVGSRSRVLEFNVPKSNPNQSIVHPGPEDQYPIQLGDFVSPFPGNPSLENDWAVFTVGPNTQSGQTPIQAQGKFYNVSRDAPGNTIRITGFGSDTGIDNLTQQTHTGPLSFVNNIFVRYRADTTGGNSGGPIIDEATGNAVGVHAYGGCTATGGSNFGERVTIPAFWDAMGLDDDPNPIDECTGNVTSFPFSESFETNLGQWVQATSGDDLNWTRNSGSTPSADTGPSNAVDGDFYLYVEASGSGTGFPNKRAILNSPCLNFSSLSTPKLSFQYHMVGSAINSLSVEARTNNTGNWISVFSRTGAQGTDWNTADIDLSAYAGNASVQLRFNAVTGSGTNGWQSDIAIDAISIQNGTTNPSDCDAINFNDFAITSFSNQDAAGNFSVVNGGAGLSLQNNTWKYIAMNYTVTANTVIEFDFSSTSEGEIHAIGFEDDNSLTSTRYVKVYGTQNYGITNFDNYSSGTKNYVVPVGNFYTGNMDRLVFINDNDTGSGNNSVFSNVKIYEGSCSQSVLAESLLAEARSVSPVFGDEEERDLVGTYITPNPTRDNFSIYLSKYLTRNVIAHIYTILGSKKGEVTLQPGVNTLSGRNLSLESGIYLIKIENSLGESTTHKLIIN